MFDMPDSPQWFRHNETGLIIGVEFKQDVIRTRRVGRQDYDEIPGMVRATTQGGQEVGEMQFENGRISGCRVITEREVIDLVIHDPELDGF